MTRFGRMLIIGAACAATTLATAAAAQPYGGGRDAGWRDGSWRDGSWRGAGGRGFEGRLQQLDRLVDRGARRGELTRTERDRLEKGFSQVAHRIEMYRAHGYTRSEARDLQDRFARFEALIQDKLHNNEVAHRGRYDRYSDRR